MQFKAESTGPAFADAMTANANAMAVAATAAMRQVVARSVAAGRQSIAAGGFGPKWQNALQGKAFPQNAASLKPAGEIRLKIAYASVFENGAVIAGQPTLWLPIEQNLPASSRKWSPKLYIQTFGPLVLVKHAGRKPLLFDPRRKRFVFVGVALVSVRKHFDVEQATAQTVAEFDALYHANFRVD